MDNNSTNNTVQSVPSYLGDKMNTKIKYDNVLTTCENIRNNIITDLKNVLDDYNDIKSKKNLIWQGSAADRFFVKYSSNLDRYEQYLIKYSLENYIKSVENLVANNKSVDKEISADEIARISEAITAVKVQPIVDTSNVARSSENEEGKNAEDKIHASINSSSVSGQNDTSKVGSNNNINSSINSNYVSGQNDTTNVGSNNNINQKINNITVEGQSDTADYVVSDNGVKEIYNSATTKGQSDTASKVEIDRNITNVSSVDKNNNISNSEQNLMNDIFNLSGGDQ